MSKPLMVDLYCGLGGWASGGIAEGYYVVGFDIERHDYGDAKYPAQLVLQDVLTLHGSQFKDAALIVASPPCFVADTLILTARGLMPIPEVMAGDLVLTHRKRWRRVLRTGSTIAPTVIASGYGGCLEGTAEHPIYARRNDGGFSVWDKEKKTSVNVLKKLGEPAWVPLANVRGCHWGSPAVFDPLAVPALPNSFADVPEFWWIVGRWVGDGWVRLREETNRGDSVIICCGHSEADELEKRLAVFAPRTGRRANIGELHWHRSRERTATRFTAASNSFAQWLTVHFGRGASMKSWPAWALGMNENNRQAMLAGYVSADGSKGRNGSQMVIKATTVSKRLAVGTKLLAASLGATSNLHFTRRPATCRIEGRVVRQRDTWTVIWTPDSENNRLVESRDGFLWGVVRNVRPAQEAARVWNLEVDEDNSYTANGIVVHNCQEYSYMAMPWSRAKAIAAEYRSGARDVKKLTALFDACFRIQREAIEAAGHFIPLVVENVRGACPWVGRSRWNYGSFHLWGDVPALMPMTIQFKAPGKNWNEWKDWDGRDETKPASVRPWGHVNKRDGHGHTRHLTNQAESDGVKCGGDWFNAEQPSIARMTSSKSSARKAASAAIAKIPLPLAQYIARVYKP